MKNHLQKDDLYFVHGFYMSDYAERREDTLSQFREHRNEINRNHMVLMQDSFDNMFNIQAFDIDAHEFNSDRLISSGDYVRFDGERLIHATEDTTATLFETLNKYLITTINTANNDNRPYESKEKVKECFSYHINVGHGTCSIGVLSTDEKSEMWMVDCSVYDFTEGEFHKDSLDSCMEYIKSKYNISFISKLLITHLHYDHINGIEYLIEKKWINYGTEVWMNTQYPWKQPTYNRILLKLSALGVRFIDPIMSNSTREIKVLYPAKSYNSKNHAPGNNINNSSVLYQICINGKSMLFTGDIETEGWNLVSTCFPHLRKTTYLCISHHGSLTGFIREKCPQYCGLPCPITESISFCASKSRVQILMGRNNAYTGIYNSDVISAFNNVVQTEDANSFIELSWQTDTYLKDSITKKSDQSDSPIIRRVK